MPDPSFACLLLWSLGLNMLRLFPRPWIVAGVSLIVGCVLQALLCRGLGVLGEAVAATCMVAVSLLLWGLLKRTPETRALVGYLVLVALTPAVLFWCAKWCGTRGIPPVNAEWRPWTVGLLLVCDPCTRLLRSFLGALPARPSGKLIDRDQLGHHDGGAGGYGEVIGVLERVLILPMIVAGKYEALGLVLAAKTIARHKKMEDEDFAEYFLVGTLSSILLVFGVAALLNAGLFMRVVPR